MNRQISPAPVRKSIIVEAGIDHAFQVFTKHMGRWWLKTHTINAQTTQSDVVMEPRPQGRWYEIGADGSECQWGHVIAWDPPRRLVLAWQITADWKFDRQFVTELEVRFSAEGPDKTRVELEHRDLERFGEQAEKIRAEFDSTGGWTGLLNAFGEAVKAID